MCTPLPIGASECQKVGWGQAVIFSKPSDWHGDNLSAKNVPTPPLRSGTPDQNELLIFNQTEN